MAGRIPQGFLDDLLARCDIAELIGSRVALKKRGNNYHGLCPFHNEKTPSFTVSATKQFYHCFGCGAHGNAIGFLMEYDRMEFLDAVAILAAQHGLEIPRDGDRPQAQHKNYYELLDKISRFYQNQLRKSNVAIEYLKSRGLTGQVAKDYAIGFAPPGWDQVLSQYGVDKDAREDLFTMGMLVRSERGKIYDRFRNRIMFPIRDRRGRVIGFGGRVLDNSEQPKYLNSPETPVFHKGREIYGLYEAKQHSNKLEKIIIVEGYMDVVSLAQYGICNAVATLGTAVTKEHLINLLRQSQHLIFCFDGDRAGREAARRALHVALPLMEDGIQVQFMFIPEGDDPDSLVRKLGHAGFHRELAASQSIADFLLQELLKGCQLATLDGRAQFAKLAMETINIIPASLFRELLLEQIAQRAGVSVEQLNSLSTQEEDNASATANNKLTPVRLAIALLLQAPELAAAIDCETELANLQGAGIPLLMKLIKTLKQNPTLSTGALLEHWRDDANGVHLAKLAMLEHPIPAEGLQAELLGVLSRLLEQGRDQKIESLLAKSKQNSLSDAERQQLHELLVDK